MAITYKEAITTGTESVAAIKQAILTSSDWAHLQLTTGTQATTLAAAAAATATTISTVATIPSGSYVVIGNGSANPEVRLTTAVSGAGPYTITFVKPLEASYGSGAAVGVGTYVKATTTRGAQMVVDFLEAVPAASQITLALYRTHNGTTGVDKTIRYLTYSISALTNTVRIKVSASKEHLYVEAEGPRAGETGSDTQYGPVRRFIFLGDLTPYFVGDTVPAVVAIMSEVSGSASGGQKAMVSRNQSDTDSWVPSSLMTMCYPFNSGTAVITSFQSSWQQVAKADGKIYVFPYIVVEDRDGLRGRLSSLFFSGFSQTSTYNPQSYGIVPFALTEGSMLSYGGTTYRVFKPISAGTSNTGALALAMNTATNNDDYSPLIALPYSTP